nr:hypothetical protein CFP56_09579 [Quercus suber]
MYRWNEVRLREPQTPSAALGGVKVGSCVQWTGGTDRVTGWSAAWGPRMEYAQGEEASKMRHCTQGRTNTGLAYGVYGSTTSLMNMWYKIEVNGTTITECGAGDAKTSLARKNFPTWHRTSVYVKKFQRGVLNSFSCLEVSSNALYNSPPGPEIINGGRSHGSTSAQQESSPLVITFL